MSKFAASRIIELAIVIFWLHLLRNISPAYFAVQAITLLVALYVAVRFSSGKSASLLVFVFVLSWLYATAVSLFFVPEYGNPAAGFIRLFAILPYILLIFFTPHDLLEPERIWTMFAAFIAVAALSIALQILIGPISWFAQSSERAGFARYASLVGSLTSYGMVVGIGILISVFLFRGVQRYFFVAILILGALLSLQKAALGNIVVALALSLWVLKIRARYLLWVAAASVVSVIVLAIIFPQVANMASATVASAVGYVDEAQRSDVSIFESIVDRWTYLPAESINHFGVLALVTGVGVYGGSGSLGYPELPMMHNTIGDLYIIFGAVWGTALMVLLTFALGKSIKMLLYRQGTLELRHKLPAAIFFISFVNALFASGSLFQPVAGFALWYSLVEVLRANTKENRGAEEMFCSSRAVEGKS